MSGMDPWHYFDVTGLSDRELFALQPLALSGRFNATELSPLIRSAQTRDRYHRQALASALVALKAFYV